MNPLSQEEALNFIADNDREGFVKIIQEAFMEIAQDNDVVFIDGTDYQGNMNLLAEAKRAGVKLKDTWLATNGVFPYNHPEVDFQNKRSVFRQHPLKNATAIGFSLGLLASDEAPEEVMLLM